MNIIYLEKREEEQLDLGVNFSAYLTGISDTITSYEILVDTGISTSLSSEADGVVKFRVSGGTLYSEYKIRVTITTTNGSIKSGVFYIKIVEFVEITI